MENKPNLPLIIGVLVVLGVCAYFFLGKTPAQAPSGEQTPSPSEQSSAVPEGATVITLTKDGFSPATVTIKKGTAVVFKSTTGSMFWPASNLHPSHLVYPEFDPKGPVQPDASWSFTFLKPGEWKFHDHLSPYFTGVITVTE